MSNVTSNYQFNHRHASGAVANAVLAIALALVVNVILLLVMDYLRKTGQKTDKLYNLQEIHVTKLNKQPVKPLDIKVKPKPPKVKRKPKLMKRKLAKPRLPISPLTMKPLSLNLNMSLLSMPSLSLPSVTVPIGPPTDTDQITDTTGGDSDVYELDMVDHPPKPLSRPAPVYPLSAKKLGLEGWTEISFIVDTLGNVTSAEVLSSSSRRFHQSSLAAVHSWKFEPAVKNEQTVAVLCRQKLKFELNN